MFHQEDTYVCMYVCMYVRPKQFTCTKLVKTKEDTKSTSLAKVKKNCSKISNVHEAYKTIKTCVDFCKVVGGWATS
jgi:hypothetical protein